MLGPRCRKAPGALLFGRAERVYRVPRRACAPRAARLYKSAFFPPESAAMAQGQLNVTPLFAVPLVEFQHPAPETINPELKALFLARAGEGDRYRNRLMTAGKNGLFESEFDLFKWPEACVQRLKAFC